MTYYTKMSPTRAKVLRMASKGLTGYAIAAKLGFTRQTIYKHIRALKRAGLLPDKDEG